MAQLTPDGEWLLYHENGGAGLWRVMRVRPRGGTPEAVLPAPLKAEFRCPEKAGTSCVIRTRESGQFVFHELDPVAGMGRELARTPLAPALTWDWDLSPDGSRVAMPVHDRTSAAIRVLPLDGKGGGSLLPIAGLQELGGVVWAADGKNWFVSTQNEHGSTLYWVEPNGSAKELYQSTGLIFAVPSPDGKRVAFPDFTGVGNVWMMRR